MIADPVTVPVVARQGHLRTRGGGIASVARGRVGVVLEQKVRLEGVWSDVGRNSCLCRASEALDHPLLVDGEIDSPANVDVVERRRGEIHGREHRRVEWYRHDSIGLGRIGLVTIDKLRRRRRVEHEIERPRFNPPVGLILVEADREHDAVGGGSSKVVTGGIPGRVPREHELAPGRPALQHVRPGGDERGAVAVVMTVGGARRDRRRRRQRESLSQVSDGLCQVHDQRVGIGSLEPRDRVGRAGCKCLGALDQRLVVDRVRPDGRDTEVLDHRGV